MGRQECCYVRKCHAQAAGESSGRTVRSDRIPNSTQKAMMAWTCILTRKERRAFAGMTKGAASCAAQGTAARGASRRSRRVEVTRQGSERRLSFDGVKAPRRPRTLVRNWFTCRRRRTLVTSRAPRCLRAARTFRAGGTASSLSACAAACVRGNGRRHPVAVNSTGAMQRLCCSRSHLHLRPLYR